jgi:hypothetical protein
MVQATVIESSDPLQTLSRLLLTVEHMSCKLTNAEGTVATMSTSLLTLSLKTFQAMLAVQCSVGAASLVTPDRDIIRTGALSDEESHFLHVRYCSKPAGTDIDHSCEVRMAPAFVTYDIAVFSQFSAFFTMHGEDAVDLSALGAQATTRVREMKVRSRL